MSNLWQFVGASVFGLPAGNDPYTWGSAGNLSAALPSTLNDGSYFGITSSAITLYNAAGTAVWTKAPSAINASGNAFLLCAWVDTVDSPANIYVLAVNSGVTTAYPAKIAISTGTVTTIGTGFTCPTSATTFPALFRNALGSGDFTLYYSPASGTSPRGLNFSSTTGAITVADGPISSNGTPLQNTSTNNSIGYRTADGTILCQFLTAQSGVWQIALTRNGKTACFEVGGGVTTALSTTLGTANDGLISLCVAGLVVVQVSISTVANTSFIRQFPVTLRTTFDAWLGTCASYMGI